MTNEQSATFTEHMAQKEKSHIVFSGYLVRCSNQICQILHIYFILKKIALEEKQAWKSSYNRIHSFNICSVPYHNVNRYEYMNLFLTKQGKSSTLEINVLIHNSLCEWFTTHRLLFSPMILVCYYMSYVEVILLWASFLMFVMSVNQTNTIACVCT